MIIRYRIFIRAVWVCHLLLAPGIVPSQTLPPDAPTVSAPETFSATAPARPAAPAGQTEEEVTIQAVQQEKDGSIYHLRGKLEIHYPTYILYADQVTYDADTTTTQLDGPLLLVAGPFHQHLNTTP